MDYKDRSGNLTKQDTSQDKFLDFVYSNLPGRALMRVLSMPWISKVAGRLLSTWPSTFFIDPFVKKNHIRMSDYEPKRYRSYNEFFTRKIRPKRRPIDTTPEHLIAPCDGKVTVYPIDLKTKIKIKHSTYTIASMLQDEALAAQYTGGYCVVLRLTVDNYHRYCYVDDADKGRNHFIKGALHTVNPAVLEHIKIYKENSRSYCVLDTSHFGKVIQMEVGALMVGKINNYHRKAKVSRGQEKGRFEFGGSTVVLLLQRDQVAIDDDILQNSAQNIETLVSMGERIGKAMFL
ncbi:MAG: phosphatidylserine decarboxylase [Lachnospiraceae bacterium]|nr:phosphatidylserine decarboxylase [Lachnospiraceae bacterium]